ncbi:MAG: DUF86 domain-containing protein [Selenomonadaceae bacterium]|nr:DUF86 domain-containing protein [Selenomonadaceae bacterium]
MRKKRRREANKLIIAKMIDYCSKIETFMERFGGTFENYCRDEAFQLSCSACIIQIGELTARLSEKYKEGHPEIMWNEIRSLRNVHAHEYENVDLGLMWTILTRNIPELKDQLRALI